MAIRTKELKVANVWFDNLVHQMKTVSIGFICDLFIKKNSSFGSFFTARKRSLGQGARAWIQFDHMIAK